MSKLPAFQFYPADWRKDPGVQALSFHDRGVWFEILCLMHESEQRGRLLLNGEPMPDEALARLLGLDKQILTKTLSTLLQYGVASRDAASALVCRRMLRDENLRKTRAEAGKKGGNPLLLKQNSSKRQPNDVFEVNQNRTPSSSSSTSVEKDNSETELSKKKGRRLPDPFLLTAEMRQWAKERRPEIDPALETEKFANYWRAKTGKDATKLDWRLTWNNWILSARSVGNGKNQQHRPGNAEIIGQQDLSDFAGIDPIAEFAVRSR